MVGIMEGTMAGIVEDIMVVIMDTMEGSMVEVSTRTGDWDGDFGDGLF